MVQIPRYEAQQGLDSPRVPRVQAEDGIGQALQRVGSAAMSAGNEIGNTAAYLRSRAQQKQRFDARIGLDKLNVELDRDLTEAERNAPADGDGLYEGFVGKSLNPKSQAFLASITDPEVRDEYARELEAFRMRWENTGVDKQYALGNRYAINQVGEMGNARARGIAENPAAVDDYVREMDEIIDNAPNTTAAQRAEMKRQFRQNAPAIVADSLKQTDIEALHFASGGGSNKERIQFLARRLRPALTQAESSGNPNAVSPVGAVGLMQVMPDTGEEIARKLGDKAYAAMSHAERVAFLKNPENNVRYGTTYLEMMLERYNGDVEAALVAYNAGPGNADKFVAAGRDYGVLPKRGETEPYVKRVLGNMGAAKLASGPAAAPEIVGPNGSRSGFVSAAFADMPAPDLMRVQDMANAAFTKAADVAKQQEELAQVNAEQMIAQDVATLRQTGQASVPTVEFDMRAAEVAKVLGPEKLTKWIEDRTAAQRIFEYTNDMDGMTEAAISTRLQQLTPRGGADATIQQTVFDAATKKAEAVLKARADDPGLAVQQVPEVKASAQAVDWQKPESVQSYLGQVEAAQVMLGTPRALLPKSQADQLGQQIRTVLRTAPDPSEAAKSFLATMEPIYGRFTDDVFTQAYETLLDKDLTKDTRDLVSQQVLDWARETPGMVGWRHTLTDEMVASDTQPKLDEAADQRSAIGAAIDWLTNAPPPAPPPPPAPELPPAPRARPITVDGVPAEAVDAYMQNAGDPKIQSMFKRTYGSDALRVMQDQLKERGMVGAAN